MTCVPSPPSDVPQTMRPPWWVGPELAVERARDRDEGDAPMSGRCRGRARNIWAGRRQVALAVLLTGSTLLSAVGTVALPYSARAQSEGDWVDPLADAQMTDISANVDQTIADVWNGDSGDDWVEPAPVVAAPVDAAPTYDANGNIIDPVSGAPLAIGPDGAPIDAAAGLYFDEAGNLIDPATGMAVAYDTNGQPVVSQEGQAAAPDGRSTGPTPTRRRKKTFLSW